MSGKLIIISAPSGAGKTTIVKALIQKIASLRFAVSATTRVPRGNEHNGMDYYFFSKEEFFDKVSAHEFVEYEEVYEGTFYGTLRSEIERIWKTGKDVIFDLDVKGGIRLKEMFGSRALSIFVQPPNDTELKIRLHKRGTETEEKIEERFMKSKLELKFAPMFDRILVNDDLKRATLEAEQMVGEFLSQGED